MFPFTCQPQWDYLRMKEWSDLVSLVLDSSGSDLHPSDTCLMMPGIACSHPQLAQVHFMVHSSRHDSSHKNVYHLDFDAKALPFRTASFDRLIVPFTLDFLATQEEQQACLSEMCRALSPSGVIDLIQWRFTSSFFRSFQWYHRYALPQKRLGLRKTMLKSLLQPLGCAYNEINVLDDKIMLTSAQKAMLKCMRYGQIKRDELDMITSWGGLVSCEGGV